MAPRRPAAGRRSEVPGGPRTTQVPGRRRRRLSRTGVVLVLAVLPTLGAGPAVAADDPASSPTEDLVSGVEGSKAALVRIEVSATAEIAHIDHSTGDVNVLRGRYEVPIRSGTGVFTSSDGVIATAGSLLSVAEDDVVVYAANRLFQEQMGTALVGNDGDLSRRAQAVDPYWAPHLQHCYERVEHCVLFFVPQFTVFPYTREPTSSPADQLLPAEGPGDIGLLRISGGGGTPTAEVTPPEQAVPERGLLTGFTSRPEPELTATQMTVALDPASGALSSDEDIAGALGAGLIGGPVLDPATGRVAGLATTVDGKPALVSVHRLHEALGAAEAPPAGSAFDAVFRRGVDHLRDGQGSASAVSSFRESLTYYDSALAAQHLAQAEEAAGAAPEDGSAPAAEEDGSGILGGPTPWIGAAAIAALLLGLALLLRRRRARPGGPQGAGPARAAVPAAATTAAARPAPVLRAASDAPTGEASPSTRPPARPGPEDARAAPEDRTRLKQSPALATAAARPAQRSPAFCWDCGGPLRERARYCGACGSPVE